MKRLELFVAALAAVTTATLAACSGSASDTAEADTDAAGGTVDLHAYALPKPGFDALIPAFQETEEGEGVVFRQSYGPSGDRSREVRDGAEADFVNFSTEPDITRLVDAGLVDESWKDNAYNGVPFGSVVTMIVREGNPENIRDWDDLLRPDIEVVTPDPFGPGSATWNLLAPYAAKSDGGADPQAGVDYLTELVTEHVKVQPKSGREATETFLQGTGDVLLGYENEALHLERNGEPVEHVTPPVTIEIENPAAVVKNAKDVVAAQAFNDFLYTRKAQRLWAEAGFRPVDPGVAEEFAAEFPQPGKLWTVDDLGGWDAVNEDLFADGTGAVAVIYDNAFR